jgi:uncharacterized membrane protein YphA (DoxX/SURF4 family)
MTSKARSIGYWLTTSAAALLFAVPGVSLLARVPHFTEEMAHLGYPAYFLGFLGVWKVLGAVAILLPSSPRLKEWAYAGMLFDISGALVSRAASGDSAVTLILPVVIAAIVITSWALRPASRMLLSHPADHGRSSQLSAPAR